MCAGEFTITQQLRGSKQQAFLLGQWESQVEKSWDSSEINQTMQLVYASYPVVQHCPTHLTPPAFCVEMRSFVAFKMDMSQSNLCACVQVLSRLEGEHFRLSVEVAQEAKAKPAETKGVEEAITCEVTKWKRSTGDWGTFGMTLISQLYNRLNCLFFSSKEGSSPVLTGTLAC